MGGRAVRVASVALVVGLVVAGIAGAGAAAPGGTAGTIAQMEVDPDDVSLGVELRADGSAAWTIEYRVRLDDDNTTRAFESLQADIAANDTRYVEEFRARMVATADAAEDATGREMAIRNVSVEATQSQLPQEYGVLTYTFVWTNFAVVDGDTIAAGDALAGFFLDSETSLQVSWPAGYGVETVQPTPDDRRPDSRLVAWDGPLEFGANEPTLVVAEAAAGGATATPDGAGGGTGDGAGGDGPPVGAIVVGAIGLAAVVVGAWFVYRRRATDDAPSGDGGSADELGNGADAAGAAGGSTESNGHDGGAADTQPWDDELLSNRETVLTLLEHEGGRMKQQAVAETLEWTDAKTSQVVGKLRDDGDLDAFRLGRENVLVLPGEEFGPSDPDGGADDSEE